MSNPQSEPSARLVIGITGASGFIGREIVAVAIERGHEVIAFSRNPNREVAGTSGTRDFSDPERADYSGLDAVMHLAGEPIFGIWSEKKKKRIRDSRIGGTQALVRGIEKMRSADRPGVFICASAVGFYGDSGEETVDEDSDAGFGFLAEVVSGWEAAASEGADIGMRSVFVRIGFVLGESGGALPLMSTLFRRWLGGRLGAGRQWMSWVHVRDVARAFVESAENEALSGPVNAVAPNPVTNREFTAALAARVDKPALFPVPSFVLRCAPGGMYEMFLFSQRVDPSQLRLREFTWEFPDLESALADAVPETGEERGTVVN